MKDAHIYPNVKFGRNPRIGRYVIVGKPPRGEERALQTIIGDNALISSHTVIYAGNKIGDNFQTGHGVMVREKNTIGDNVSIGTGSDVEHHVKIGDGVRIHSNVFIPEYSEIHENAWLGPNVVLTNTLHPLCPKIKKCLKGPTIKKNAKIGANSTILPHVIIGENAFVAAGSVVTKDIEKNKVVAGNPAKVIKDVSELKCRFNYIKKPYSD